MKINLTEELWNLLNPEFDGHYGIGNWAPAWQVLPNLCILPIMTFTPADIGKKESKSFVVHLKGAEYITIHIPQEIEVIGNCLYLFSPKGERILIAGENVISMIER